MPSRRSFLRQSLALGAGSLLPLSWARAAAGGKKPPYLVVVVVAGGWDTTYCIDPKRSNASLHGPDSDEGGEDESIETFGYDLRVAVNDAKRPSVSAFFNQYGSQSTIVSGIEVGSVTHRSCMDRMLTGSRAGNHAPDFAAIVGSTYGNDRPLACLDTCGQSRGGPLAASIGRLGAQSQIVMLLDREKAFDAPTDFAPGYPQIVPDSDDMSALDTYLRDRAAVLESQRAQGGRNSTHFANYRESLDREVALRKHTEQLTDSLRLGQDFRHLDVSGLVASLFTDGICQTALVDSGQAWDTHEKNTDQHDSYEGLFALLNGMMGAIEGAGIADETVVAVVSEFSRTPMLNEDLGKDHWPVTSALLIGPRVGTGRTVGGTDDTLAPLPVDLASGNVDESSGTMLNYESFVAGVLQAVDVDPEEWFPGSTPVGII